MNIRSIQDTPLFASLNEDQIDEFVQLGVINNYKKYDMILFEGEVESKFFLILEGRVKVSRFTEEGEEAVFAFLGEGDFFGELSVFEDQTRDSNVITIESSRILVLHRSDFINLVNKYSQININLLKEMTQKIRRRNAHIKSLTVQNATGKVAHTILRLVDDYGAFHLGKIEINKLPTHRDIASMIGTSRETISRALKSLISEGYIQREGNKVVICDYQNFHASFS